MLSGDFLMRQVHQLAQVLARILVRRQTEAPESTLEEIGAAWAFVPGLAGRDPAGLHREELLNACSDASGALHPETVFAVADLLALEGDLLVDTGREAEARARWRRALWLYEAASRDAQAAVPLDLMQRMARLADAIHDGESSPTDDPRP